MQNTHRHTDSDEYSIVAFCKNVTIIIMFIMLLWIRDKNCSSVRADGNERFLPVKTLQLL